MLMDCATTGVEPDFALLNLKIGRRGYFRIVNESVPSALKALGHTESQINDILNYVRGTADITHAPHINTNTLKAKGFNDEDIKK